MEMLRYVYAFEKGGYIALHMFVGWSFGQLVPVCLYPTLAQWMNWEHYLKSFKYGR